MHAGAGPCTAAPRPSHPLASTPVKDFGFADFPFRVKPQTPIIIIIIIIMIIIIIIIIITDKAR